MVTIAQKHSGQTLSLPAPENKLFYPALDGFRAMAVLLVFWGHYEGGVYPRLSWGWAGVNFFFVLSGFLITGILYDTQDSAHRLRNFYARRTLRIFPLYYGVLLLALATTPIFHWMWNKSWLLWFTYLGNYSRFLFAPSSVPNSAAIEHLVAQAPFPYSLTVYTGHFWSLCVEEQFYLLWPMLVFAIRKRETLRNFCIVTIVLCLVARIVLFFTLPKALVAADFLGRVTPFTADALLTGGLIALCLRGPEVVFLRRMARPLLAAFAACFAVFELTSLEVSPQHAFYAPDFASPILNTIGFTLLNTFAGLLVILLLTPKGWTFWFFNLRWLRALGKVSYGFYVFHDLFHLLYADLAHQLTHHRGPSVNLTTLIGFVCTTLLAVLSYRYYELPFLKLKRRFIPE